MCVSSVKLFLHKVERRLREIAKRDAGKGVILRHLNMANRLDLDILLQMVGFIEA